LRHKFTIEGLTAMGMGVARGAIHGMKTLTMFATRAVSFRANTTTLATTQISPSGLRISDPKADLEVSKNQRSLLKGLSPSSTSWRLGAEPAQKAITSILKIGV
jgi:hypothetical protein